jgi:DNA-directed RNA polymerase subunit RPC12/RpoP/preprotein translocase subunit SecG
MKFLNPFLLLVFLLSSTVLFSRAGGGGGGSSSSGSSSSSHSSYSSSSHHSSGHGTQAPPWVVKIVVALVLGVVLFFIIVIVKAIIYAKRNPDPPGEQRPKKLANSTVVESLIKSNPGFQTDAFIAKVKIAFLAIQKAWQNQDLSMVRNWISDGLYQRFILQFDMMNQLGQKNMLTNISIIKVEYMKAYTEGSFSVITVAIYFQMNDQFISEKMPELNENYIAEHGMEYWTFIKKSGAINKNLYTDNSCPNCGNELNTNGGEVSKCPSCQTITYLGDYDWVLSDITQEEDYDDDINEDVNKDNILALFKSEDACMQTLEDKAAKAFIHYLFASAWNKPELFNRFGTPEVVANLRNENDKPFIYNRFYINRVTFSDSVFEDHLYHLSFEIVYTSQRVRLLNGKIRKLDKEIETHWGEITLSRKEGKTRSKSRLWSYECAHCGAPYTDSISTVCTYCNEKINTPDYDWIVTSINKA